MVIEGIIPALLTPFDSSGRIDEAMLRRLVRYQIDAGATGFFVCGSAGEGVYMSPDERRRVVSLVSSESAGQAAVIAHVGAMSTQEAALLAREARDAGAHAVASMPPLVFKQPWPAIIEHIRAIAEASELPTYYYHIPVISHVDVTVDQIAEMADRVPGLVGLKFTSPDLYLLWGVLDRPKRKLETLYGCDQQLVQGLMTGARGGIGSTYNYQMENVVALHRAYQQGNLAEAMKWQGAVNRVIDVLMKHGANRGTEKAMMTLRGYDVGPPRRPTPPFPAENLDALRRDMELVGLV
ncbi:MAG: dihydrodipicolinate synthase family protein [Candidatus Hydrogenedentes bacterium]|nr:dihydrodipicolinate synthase family protein [Candidatus Hydrogenedentota bacterium]